MSWAHHGDCDIWYETFGDAANPALLMVNGLGSQSINYQDAWCQMFADEGLFVIRYDNRDVGLSSSFAGAPVGELGNAYVVSDMAADGMAVLDALGIDRTVEALEANGLQFTGTRKRAAKPGELSGAWTTVTEAKGMRVAEGDAPNSFGKSGGNPWDALRASRIGVSKKPLSKILVSLLYQVRTYFQNK